MLLRAVLSCVYFRICFVSFSTLAHVLVSLLSTLASSAIAPIAFCLIYLHLLVSALAMFRTAFAHAFSKSPALLYSF